MPADSPKRWTSTLSPISAAGLAEAIDQLTRFLARLDVRADIHASIGVATEELLLNSTRHGAATLATIDVAVLDPTSVDLILTDNGTPFDTPEACSAAEPPATGAFTDDTPAGLLLIAAYLPNLSWSRLPGGNRLQARIQSTQA